MLLVACGMTVIPHNNQMLEALAPGEIKLIYIAIASHQNAIVRLKILLSVHDWPTWPVYIKIRSRRNGNNM